MKRIVILGSSPAGVKVIEEIRCNDSSSEITLLSFDGHYPYKREAFAAFIAKEITSENVFCRSKDFYKQHKVNVVLDKKISRINVNRKKIFTEDKEQFDYDVLIVTDTPENRFPDIKGTNRGGVFGYKKLKDIDRIINTLSLVETVVIQSDSFAGLQAALAFAKQKKEVILVSSGDNFLTRHFASEVVEQVVCKLQENGLRIMQDNAISEILGEKDARAVRLKSGKVFSAEMVLFCEMDEDLRLFSSSGLKMNQKIDVDAQFKANVDDLFIVDQACGLSDSEPVTPLSVLEEQGKAVAAAINGLEYSYCDPASSWELNVDGLSIAVLGHTQVTEKVEVRRTFDQESGKYTGLYVVDNCLVGAVLVNMAGDERDEFWGLINKKAGVEPISEKPVTDEPSDDGDDAGQVDSEDVSVELIDN